MEQKLLNFDAYFFDLDGTLLNTTPDIAAAINMVREDEGLERLSDRFIEAGVGYGATELLKHCFPNSYHQKAALLREKFTTAYAENVCIHTIPYPHAVSALEYLNKEGKTVVLITNKPTRFADPLLTQLDWKKYFSALYYGDTCTERKPSPVPLLAALEKYQYNREQVLFIGDTEADALAAQAAHIPLAIVNWGRAAKLVKEGQFGSTAQCIELSELHR